MGNGGISGVYDVIKEKIAEYSSYGMFINFSIGDNMLSTTNNQGYLMSLEHEKIGAGAANNFSINVAYHPDPDGDSLLDSGGSIIEESLLAAQDCVYTYGYIFPDGTIASSPKYTGRILDYTVEIRNSMVLYRISGYSNITNIKDVKINKTHDELKALAGGTFSPVKLVVGLLNEAIEEQGLNCSVVDESSKYPCALNEDLFTAVSDQYLFEYIRSILNSTRAVGQESQVDTKELILYQFIMDDKIEDNGKSTLRIVATDPSDNEQDVIDFVFNWMSGRSDDIVLDFTPNFSGAVAMAMAHSVLKTNYDKSNSKSTNTEEKKYTIDSEGKTKEVPSSGYTSELAPISGDSSEVDALAVVGTVGILEQQIYTATLTTLGVPDDVPILTHMKVVPLIYGKPHHTAGEYYSTKQTDSLSSAGYTSTFELFKVAGGEEFREMLDKASGAYQKRVTDGLKNPEKVFGRFGKYIK